jgi:hypothetical protein
MIYIYFYDKNSFYNGFTQIKENESLSSNSTTISPFFNGGKYTPYVKPKWNGEKWSEGATEAEISISKKIAVQLPTIEERLSSAESAILKIMGV